MLETVAAAPIANARDLNSLNELLQFNLCYIGSPYSFYRFGLERAYADVSEVSWFLQLAGVSHFSPILYTHPLSKMWRVDPRDASFWLDFDSSMMNVCDALVIIDLDGWQDSAGVAIETSLFEQEGKPVYHLNPATLELRHEIY